jgi:hypothetical protein
MRSPRRFPPPWIVEEHAESFIVRDATGQALGYFYFDNEPPAPLGGCPFSGVWWATKGPSSNTFETLLLRLWSVCFFVHEALQNQNRRPKTGAAILYIKLHAL